MICYISLKGELESHNISKIQAGKRDSFLLCFVFCFEAKTTRTVKYHCWLNIISPKMRKLINVFDEENSIFQIFRVATGQGKVREIQGQGNRQGISEVFKEFRILLKSFIS